MMYEEQRAGPSESFFKQPLRPYQDFTGEVGWSAARAWLHLTDLTIKSEL